MTSLREHFLQLIQERNSRPPRRVRRKAKKSAVPKSIENILQTLSPEKQVALLHLLGLDSRKED